MDKKIPAISIVTPMYNAEKYIADCLDSVLVQKFTDYEMIIVDDCSTDKSCAIVESYIPKFGGRLKLFKSEKNSGSPSVPRNRGIFLSRGEYICFLDSDDGIMPTALEEIHSLTEKFKVDVIHCEKYYRTTEEGFTTDKNHLEIKCWELQPNVEVPTFLENDLEQRVEAFSKAAVCLFSWCHIVRRDFLIQNNITFAPMRVSGDYPYTFHITCAAKTFLRVPNIFHVYRDRDDSQSRLKDMSMEKWVHSRIQSIFCGLNSLNKIMDTMEFFSTKPKLRYDVLDIFLARRDYDTLFHFSKFPVEEMNPLIQNELEDDDIKVTPYLISFLFSRMNRYVMHFTKCYDLMNTISEKLQKQTETVQTQAAKIKRLEMQLAELKNK